MAGRRRINRPDPLPQGLSTHRGDAANALSDWYVGGQPRGDLGFRLDYLTGRADRDVPDLVRDIGTTAEVARATGASPRTVRDWRAGTHAPSPAHRDALERAARKSTVEQLGGTRAVAGLTGRSASSVRSWVRKPVTVKGDAVHRLNKHEVRDRHHKAMRQAKLRTDKKVILVLTDVRVRVKPPGQPDYDYEYDRDVRTELPEDVRGRMEDAIARGDADAVQHAIEEHLTTTYSGIGEPGDYNGRDQGFFVDRIDPSKMKTFDH